MKQCPQLLPQKSTLEKAGGGASEATAQDKRPPASPTTVSKLKDRLESENLTTQGWGIASFPIQLLS